MARTVAPTSWTLLAGSALALGALAGCGKDEPKRAEAPTPPAVASTTVPVVQASTTKKQLLPELHRPFKDAVLLEPPVEANCPPDRTVGGKIVGKLFEEIAGVDGEGGLWDQVKFVTPDGQRIHYTAILRTKLGEVTLELLPDVAPNHVRNFICLAKVGYYDGLSFDRILSQTIENTQLTGVEAGCPLGTGEAGYGSIGYWLKPELSKTAKHEEGAVGASHGEALETAACKFYITLGQAPWMDENYTIFGKVTRGLDVARAIFRQPVLEEGFRDRPKEPVKIDTVVIQSSAGTLVAQGR